MWFRRIHAAPFAMQRRAPRPQLAHQMVPLVPELPRGALNLRVRSYRSYFSTVERVPARLGLQKHGSKVSVDRRSRSGVRLESQELGVMAIARRLAPKDRARQKRFTPQGDQALRVEIFRVEGPDAHAGDDA